MQCIFVCLAFSHDKWHLHIVHLYFSNRLNKLKQLNIHKSIWKWKFASNEMRMHVLPVGLAVEWKEYRIKCMYEVTDAYWLKNCPSRFTHTFRAFFSFRYIVIFYMGMCLYRCIALSEKLKIARAANEREKKIEWQWNSIWRSSRMARTRHLCKNVERWANSIVG